MKGTAAVLAITFLVMGSLFAQVHIRENAIITPAEPRRSQSGETNNHSIRFEFYWDHPMWAGVVFGSSCGGSDSTVSSDTSPIIIDLFAASTIYYFYPRLDMSYGEGPETHVSYKFYADNLLVRADSADLEPYGGCCGTWWWECPSFDGLFWTSYYSGFSFSLGAGELVCGDSTAMGLSGDLLDCNPPLWSPHTDQVTLTITSGRQYLSFHEIDPQTGEDIALGASATTTGDNIGQYSLVADGITPDPAGSAAVIQAESNGTTRTQSILVYPGFDHFDVWTEPDTAVHSSFSNIYVQAKDAADNDVVIPADEPLHVTADDSGKYGEIEEWWSTHLSYSYGDANGGAINYNADQNEPEGVQKISIKVVDANSPKRTGSGDLFLEGDIAVEVVPPEISPGDTALVTVEQRNSDGSLSDFSSDQEFEIGISSGMDYGTLLMSDGSTGGYFANASQPFNFKAADSINADSVMVGIRVGWQPPAASSIAPGGKGSSGHNMSSKRTTINTSIESSGVKPSAKKVSASATGSKSVSDASDFTVGDYGVVWVEIKKNKGCPSVVFSADTINPGDTVDVTVRKENDDGTITDYPPGTTFNIGILSGGDYGSLLAGGELGSSFDNVDVPIQFIANENNAVDSVVVSIRATANLDVSGSVLQNAKALNKGIKKVSNVKKNGKKFLTDEGGVCSLFSNLYIQGVELIVVYPTDEMKDKKDITADPTMPDITAKAKLENFKGDSVHFQWNLRVQWEGDDGRQFDDPFKGNTAAKNSDVSSWNIKWDKIRGGDEITLDVTATAGGKVYDKTINHPFIITGLNPSIAQVKESLSLQEQVTVFLESVPKWKHFRKDHDFPVWGSPNGYGLMQLDRIPPTKRHPTDDEVWNWRINRATGQDVLRQKLDLAVKYGRNIREGTVYRDQPAPYDWYKEPITHKIVEYENATDLTTEEQLWKETFHSYRGGVYWRWRPINPSDPESPGEWIAQPTQNHERGDEAWTIYQDVLNGNPPPGWNQ